MVVVGYSHNSCIVSKEGVPGENAANLHLKPSVAEYLTGIATTDVLPTVKGNAPWQ